MLVRSRCATHVEIRRPSITALANLHYEMVWGVALVALLVGYIHNRIDGLDRTRTIILRIDILCLLFFLKCCSTVKLLIPQAVLCFPLSQKQTPTLTYILKIEILSIVLTVPLYHQFFWLDSFVCFVKVQLWRKKKIIFMVDFDGPCFYQIIRLDKLNVVVVQYCWCTHMELHPWGAPPAAPWQTLGYVNTEALMHMCYMVMHLFLHTDVPLQVTYMPFLFAGAFANLLIQGKYT